MAKASLKSIVEHLDRLLKEDAGEDYPSAHNGLQVQNRGFVSKITATVDATTSTVRLAVQADANLLIVHHGLFWSPSWPWTGQKYELLRLLLDNDLAVYSCHLPLDAHPKLGNNAQLCAKLGFKSLRPFFLDYGRPIGFKTRTSIPRTDLAARLWEATGARPLLIPGGPETCRNIGVVTGGAGAELKKAAAEGIDTFVTGEGPHWTFGLAEELGVNVLYGGHYATETFGVKALAENLSKRFKVPSMFIDHPTGL